MKKLILIIILMLSLISLVQHQVYAQTLLFAGDLETGGLSDVCSQVSASLTLSKDTYHAGESVQIALSGVPPGHDIQMWYARNNENTAIPDPWNDVPMTYNGASARWEANWVVPESLPVQYPYDNSESQEFLFAFNVLQNGNLVCVGNPDYGPYGDIYCENCNFYIVSHPDVQGPLYHLPNFLKIKPGYSITYEGSRYDNPIDDNGNPVSGDFTARWEYEAPIKLCGIRQIPMRMMKSNRWGYWQPAKPRPGERQSSDWDQGLMNLRFMVTDQFGGQYQWEKDHLGAVSFKMYQTSTFGHELGNYRRSYLLTSLAEEFEYYPPYLIAVDDISKNPSQTQEFIRLDTIHSIGSGSSSEDTASICKKRTKRADHYWYARYTVLDDPDIITEFDQIKSYYSNKPIVVVTFFESVPSSIIGFREDWYLMDGVGVVGVDQATFTAESQTAWNYFNSRFMKKGTAVTPHTSMRAVRGYFGEPLSITITPDVIPAGSSYVLTAHSVTIGLPYDGYLEVDTGNGPVLWRNFDGTPIWIKNGKITIDVPPETTPFDMTARFRPKVTESPSSYENVLSYNQMPWSNTITASVVGQDGQPTCADLGGNVCADDEVCSGNFLDATDMSRCCSEQCVLPQVQYCDECGEGLFNLCDREECYSASQETCYFTDTLTSGTCIACSASTTCASYGNNEESCMDNRCNLENCEWVDNSCRTRSITPPPPPKWTCNNNYQCIEDANGKYGSKDDCKSNCNAPPPPIKGDTNDDGKVNLLDLILVAKDFGKTSNFNPRADVNGDGKVDLFDLVIVALNYGKSKSL